MPGGNLAVNVAVKGLKDEIFAAETYRRLASLYRDKALRDKLLRIAEMEENHVNYWRSFLEKRGVDPSRFGVSRLKVTLYTVILRLLGVGLALRVLELDEREAVELYSSIIESPELDEEERRGLARLIEDELVHEQEFAKEESRFEEFLAHIRDAILGMNDGLVEVLSVTAGLVGAYGDPFHVALSGLVVGVAGALSMGVGAFASVRAQRQVHEGVLSQVKTAVRYAAGVFKERVKEYMVRKGFSEETSKSVAEESARDPRLLSRVVAEEEYGLREEALEDPVKAGLYTGLFYILGAALPLLPYFLGIPVLTAMALSLFTAAAALAVTGSLVALSANLPVKRKAIEMVLLGLGSAAVTFGIGRLASILLGIEVG